ncbi:MAG: hypothetical protein QNJ16_03645 [Rhodobacter sp.]|nr:hypothetical protein [Rhodobacter sp.]
MNPKLMFQEAEGTTLVVLKSVAETNGLSYEFPSRTFTLEVHSSLEAIGFLAQKNCACETRNGCESSVRIFSRSSFCARWQRNGCAHRPRPTGKRNGICKAPSNPPVLTTMDRIVVTCIKDRVEEAAMQRRCLFSATALGSLREVGKTSALCFCIASGRIPHLLDIVATTKKGRKGVIWVDMS